jgi:uncharacterized protein (DUF1778 family)
MYPMPEDLIREGKMAFRVRVEERELIVSGARAAKMPVSAYIRETILDSARRRVARVGVEL